MSAALQRLCDGARSLDLDLAADAAQRMLDYLALLRKWNRAYNLTAVTNTDAQVAAHLLDSLSIAPFINGDSVADVGSGAGLPGIPLALAQPQKRFTLIDSRAKRTRFLREAVRVLALENVTIVQDRVEDYRPPERFATVVARAFAALPKMLDLSGHLLAEGGEIVAMKGRDPSAEVDAIPAQWRVIAVEGLSVPGLTAQRHVVRVVRTR
ncbi:MAG: 16S rRNA (guanine(527)-N(7))-methyltransferase RsmG [Gammaproteobacteria bacterium]|nr:16S rRNA (guanine(527)-N(7))-methyltransferase RsmG [Gammaproteobacteria bacterium]